MELIEIEIGIEILIEIETVIKLKMEIGLQAKKKPDRKRIEDKMKRK